jgi:hypothetical protein
MYTTAVPCQDYSVPKYVAVTVLVDLVQPTPIGIEHGGMKVNRPMLVLA